MSENTASYKNINAIDIIKFLCAILVVTIHYSPFNSSTTQLGQDLHFILTNIFARIAVPFFFCAAGFFLFRKIDYLQPDNERVKNYVFRILRLLGTWTILLFIGSKIHLWYLGALVIAVLLVYFCLRIRLSLGWILIIGCVLYCIGLCGDSYSFLLNPLKSVDFFDSLFKTYEDVFGTTRNGLFMGFIFVSMGAVITYKPISIKSSISFVGFLFSLGLLFFEALFLRSNNHINGADMYISIVPTVFFLFQFGISLNLKDNLIYGKLRVSSMLIYYSHLLFIEIVGMIFDYLRSTFSIDIQNPIFLFGCIIVLCIMSSFLIEWLSRKKGFGWMKYLYS